MPEAALVPEVLRLVMHIVLLDTHAYVPRSSLLFALINGK